MVRAMEDGMYIPAITLTPAAWQISTMFWYCSRLPRLDWSL